MSFTIYISYTNPELANVRAVLLEQIAQKGMTTAWLTDEERSRADIINTVRRKIASADAFISLVTYVHGWTPPDTGTKSLVEIECDLALEAVKPTAILMPEANSEIDTTLRMWALDQTDVERDKQHAFWANLSERGATISYINVADFAAKLTDVLTRWAAQTPPSPTTVSAQAAPAVPPASPALSNRERRDTLFPTDAVNLDELAEIVAAKTAAKVQEAQAKRDKEIVEQTLKYNEAIKIKPGQLVFGLPSASSQFKGDVFMIMPFADAFTPIYADVIRPLAKELGLSISRGDEFTSANGVIMGEVWSALNNCKFVIVEITGGNDNVFYELGIAHTLNKPAILITQASQAENVPFDIRHLRYIPYENTVSGGAKLREDLRASITRLLSDLNEEWGKKPAT